MNTLRRVWNSDSACTIFFVVWMLSIVAGGGVLVAVGTVPSTPVGVVGLAWLLGGFLLSIAWMNHLSIIGRAHQAAKYERRFQATTQSSAQSPSAPG